MRRTRQRRNGEGTVITFRKKGKPVGYAAELTIGWGDDGKRQKVRSRRFKTRPEADAELVKLRKQQAQGIDLTAKPQTLQEYGDDWLSDFALDHRPTTIATYRYAFEKRIAPRLGDLDIRHVRVPVVRKFINDLTRQGLAPRTVILVRTVLRQILDQAVEDDILEYNPCDRAKGPPMPKPSGKAIPIDQIAALLDAARGARLSLALRLLFTFGLRRGEVCGLRWMDVDLVAGTLTIRGTLSYATGYGLVRGDPKSDTGLRIFKLPAPLIAAFRWHQTRQETERRAMGERWPAPASDDEAYVFVSPTTGGALNSGRLYDTFRQAAAQIGLMGYTPHSLRHSAASYLHRQRAPKKTISTYMGHANTRITDDIYTHLFQDELNEAAQIIEDGLEAAIERHRKTGGSAP